jgi:hypothetical protein
MINCDIDDHRFLSSSYFTISKTTTSELPIICDIDDYRRVMSRITILIIIKYYHNDILGYCQLLKIIIKIVDETVSNWKLSKVKLAILFYNDVNWVIY